MGAVLTDIKSRNRETAQKNASSNDRLGGLCAGGREARRRNGDDLRETASDPGSGETQQ